MLEARLGIQRKYLRQMQELYHEDFNVVHVPLALGEVRGADKIREFAESLLVRAPQLETIMERLDRGEGEEEEEEGGGVTVKK